MRKYSVRVGYLYLELVGPYQEDNGCQLLPKAVDRFAQLCLYQRSFDVPTTPIGIIASDRRRQRRHTKPFRDRFDLIVCDKTTTPEARLLAITHGCEAYAVRGLRIALNGVRQGGDFFGVDMADEFLDSGGRYPFVPDLNYKGVDGVISLNNRCGNGPRNPCWGFNVKSSKGSPHSTKLWHFPKTDTMASNLHVGGWRISEDGKGNFHRMLRSAASSNEEAQRLFEFMERNIEPFGNYLLYQVAGAVDLCKRRMDTIWEKGDGVNGSIRVFPQEQEARNRLYEQVSKVDATLKSHGIQSTWRRHQRRDDACREFLPTTPLQ